MPLSVRMAIPSLSVVIPTWNRPEALAACLASLNAQTNHAFETITITRRGPLAALRNEGLSRARAPVVAFIDDDILTDPRWMDSLLSVFQGRPAIVGVSGPAIIQERFRRHRDLFRHRHLKRLYDLVFLHPDGHLPGRITSAGTFTTASADADNTYEGSVDYLEACHMAFRTYALKAIGGFNEAYGGIGDWSEPDVAFRLRKRYGNQCLYYSQAVRVEHRPATTGAYVLRDQCRARLSNYLLFARQWVSPSPRHTLYRAFLHGYYRWRSLNR